MAQDLPSKIPWTSSLHVMFQIMYIDRNNFVELKTSMNRVSARKGV